MEWASSIKAAADLLNSASERTGIVTELALADGNWRDLVEHVRAVSSSIPIVLVSFRQHGRVVVGRAGLRREGYSVDPVIGFSLVRSPGNEESCDNA